MADVISVLGGNWTDGGAWNDASAPTAADDVSATGAPTASGNLVVTAGAVCRSADFTNYESTLSGLDDLTIGDGTAGAGNVALKLIAGMGYTHAGVLDFVSTSAVQQTINMGGKATSNNVSFNAAGSWILSSDLTMPLAGNSGALKVLIGTFNTGGFTVTCGIFQSNGIETRSVTLGTSTLNVGLSSGTAWNVTSTGLTFSGASSTINITDTGASGKTFAGAGLTYGTVNISAGGAGAVTFTGSNTFSKINRSGTGTKTVKFTDSTTTTLTGGVNSFLSGTAGNIWTITGTSTGGWNISTSQNITVDYVNLSYCTVSGGGVLTAGVNSTNGGNNGANVVFLTLGPPVGTMSMLGVGK